jgi:hypothetical protein
MYYDCVDILPDNVKSALEPSAQLKWMNAFNSTVKKSKSVPYRDAVYNAWMAVKNDPSCRYFSGFVSTEDLDKQNDVVLVDKALTRIANHVERGGTMVDTHTNRTVGSFFYAKKAMNKTGKPGIEAYGVIYRGEPYHDAVWEQIKKGVECPSCMDVRKGYSIGGFALETRRTCDDTGCHRDIVDMSIHEISICQDPANPEAVYKEVNMMAKSDGEVKDNTENKEQICKVMRDDAPAPTQEAGPAQTPEISGQEAPQGPVGPQGMQTEMEPPLDYKKLLMELKRGQKQQEEWRKILELMRGMTDPAVAGGIAKALEEIESVEKATASNPTGNNGGFDKDIHTSVTAASCPENKEVQGDVKDAQVKDSMEFLENKNIEADESVKSKKDSDLMPSKDEVHFKEFKDGPKAEVNKEGKNTAVDEKVEALNGTDDAKISSDKLKEIGTEAKSEVSKGAEGDKKEYDMKPKDSTKTVTDNGEPREKNFGKEGKKEVMMKFEIPDELMPLFKEFLATKGIKMEPEVQDDEIEGPLEKTLLVDDDISELDLKELTDPVEFDSAEALGKVATQKLRIQMIETKLKLAKNLKVADIAYLVDNEKKNKINKAKDQFGNDIDLPDVAPVKKPKHRDMATDVYLDTLSSNVEVQGGRFDSSYGNYLPAERRMTSEDVEDMSERCPRCNEKTLIPDGRGHVACYNCGYHNIPHAGTPGVKKAWLPYKEWKAQQEKGKETPKDDKKKKSKKTVKKAGEGPMPEMPPEVPIQSDYLTSRQRAKLQKKPMKELFNRRPDEVARMEGLHRKGEADSIVNAVKGTCPKCHGNELYRFGRYEGCADCGYHNVPHAGTPAKAKMMVGVHKAWDEYVIVNKQGAAGLAMMAAQQAQETMQAPFKVAGQTMQGIQNTLNQPTPQKEAPKPLDLTGTQEKEQNAQAQQQQSQQQQANIDAQKQQQQAALEAQQKNQQAMAEQAQLPPPPAPVQKAMVGFNPTLNPKEEEERIKQSQAMLQMQAQAESQKLSWLQNQQNVFKQRVGFEKPTTTTDLGAQGTPFEMPDSIPFGDSKQKKSNQNPDGTVPFEMP